MIKLNAILLLSILSFSIFAILPNQDLQIFRTDALENNLLENVPLDDFIKHKPKEAQKLFLQMDIRATLNNPNGISRINQTHDDVKVFGSQVAYNIENGEIISRDGRLSYIEIDSVLPNLSLEQALEIVDQEISTNGDYQGSLKIYPRKDASHLVWHIKEKAPFSQWNLFVDANSGKIISRFQALTTGTGRLSSGEQVSFASALNTTTGNFVLMTNREEARSTYSAFFDDAQSKAVIPGILASSQDDTWTDSALVDAHYYAGRFLNLLKNRFNRNSFDNKGAPVISTVHFVREKDKSYINAFWNGSQMVYGDGGVIPGRLKSDGTKEADKHVAPLAGAFDVVAHEISHAITSNTSDLMYLNESGALNEAFSDIMGVYAEFQVQQTKADWKLGEDTWDIFNSNSAMRYMNNPTLDGNSRDYYPEKFPLCKKLETEEDWIRCMRMDNGGVHLNSGIANLMFYLLSEGGVHPRRKTRTRVKGIGMEKAIDYVYKAFTQKLVSSSSFSDARKAMVKVAREQRATSREIRAIKDAWSAVGVR